ncbi:hypothetical protein Acr_08g0009350 [Actinidia rufa]|uniref:Uncharacterized protein n=1 Tax=Actinidia rufa TaxID=165716 RepID=A0A7J0F2V8_9ERIC|nr:hypothetical protein Acr_08g0009350 [Actinidia rufa]
MKNQDTSEKNLLLEHATSRMILSVAYKASFTLLTNVRRQYRSAQKAVLNLNSFEKGGDGGAPSKCDHKYHSDNTPVVALSTGWFNKTAEVLEQYHDLCQWGELDIFWSDA